LSWEEILIAIANTLAGDYLPGGNVNFSNNQVTLELRGKEVAGTGSELKFELDPDTALSSIFIFSADDVGFMGNQSDCNFLIDLLFTNTAIFAVSARTCNNRFKEGLIFSLYSLLSLAFVNSAGYNQATHCLYARGKLESPDSSGNIKLFPSGFCDMIDNIFNKFFGKD
jgi:hypothetical protein